MARIDPNSESSLQIYLLGTVDFDALVRLQRRLHYEVSGDPHRASLIVCEHPTLITMGRHASLRHLRIEPQERGWPVRWVTRGGGCWLHGPGQLALYTIFPLERMQLTIPSFLLTFSETLGHVFDDFSVRRNLVADDAGVWIGSRLAATLGISVRRGVTSFGGCLNLCPDLDDYRGIRCHPATTEPMTSLERERHGPVRPSLVRERLIEHFRESYGFERVTLFSDHPLLQAARSGASPFGPAFPQAPGRVFEPRG